MPDILPTATPGRLLKADTNGRWASTTPAAAIANASESATNPPTKAEVDAIAAKLNLLLAAARAAGVIAP
jgi:hypothetical protein